MKNKLLDALIYINKNPEEGVEGAFMQPELEKVYLYFIDFKGVKHNYCPTCEKDNALTKHHIIPKGKGGKGLIKNYFYICRECHDKIHGMDKNNKINMFLEENPDITIEDLILEFNLTRNKAFMFKYPEYWMRCRFKYEKKIEKKIGFAMTMLF